MISVSAYNRWFFNPLWLTADDTQICMCRLKSVWGQDADEWRPERFIEGVESMQKTSLGVVANLYGFFFHWCVYANADMVTVQHSAVAYMLALGNVHITPWHNPFNPNVADLRLDGNLRTSPINDSHDAMFSEWPQYNGNTGPPYWIIREHRVLASARQYRDHSGCCGTYDTHVSLRFKESMHWFLIPFEFGILFRPISFRQG